MYRVHTYNRYQGTEVVTVMLRTAGVLLKPMQFFSTEYSILSAIFTSISSSMIGFGGG